MTASTLPAIPDKNDLPALFDTDDGIERVVSKIEAEARSIVCDYSTAKGRKEARSLASKVSRSKTLIDDVGKSLNDERNRLNKIVNEKRNLAKERLDALRDDIRRPAEEIEKKEAERVQAHMMAMDQFSVEKLTSQNTSAELQAQIKMIEAVDIDGTWEEFEGEARTAKAQALQKYNQDIGVAEAREAQEAELVELRREKAERDEANRQAQQEAEAKKHAEAAEKARAEAEQQAAERAKVEAEERHQRELAESKEREERAAQAERDRIAKEQQEREVAEQRRKADAENRRRIRSEIISTLAGLKPANYEEMVDAMIAGEVPHVKVMF